MDNFEDWFKRLQREAEKISFPINLDDPEAYQSYFEEGYSTSDALREEARSA